MNNFIIKDILYCIFVSGFIFKVKFYIYFLIYKTSQIYNKIIYNKIINYIKDLKKTNFVIYKVFF